MKFNLDAEDEEPQEIPLKEGGQASEEDKVGVLVAI